MTKYRHRKILRWIDYACNRKWKRQSPVSGRWRSSRVEGCFARSPFPSQRQPQRDQTQSRPTRKQFRITLVQLEPDKVDKMISSRNYGVMSTKNKVVDRREKDVEKKNSIEVKRLRLTSYQKFFVKHDGTMLENNSHNQFNKIKRRFLLISMTLL